LSLLIYGALTDTSIGKLFLAGVIPGLMMALLFMIYIEWKTRREPGLVPPEQALPWGSTLRAALAVWPILVLILAVLGSLFAGIATPTESAALGVAGSIVLALVDRKLSWQMLRESMDSTARTTSMIALILFGAYLLNYILSSLGIPQMLAKFMTGLPLPGWAIMLVIIGFYLALGTFMEGISMVITTIPLLFPVVVALGYDPIWFGVVITMLVEIAMISPPDGTVLYVLQGMRRQPGPITDVFVGVMPFLLVYMFAILVLMVFPAIALWLPAQLM
jgi:tripartite ATP-independent transporter DctM subunit